MTHKHTSISHLCILYRVLCVESDALKADPLAPSFCPRWCHECWSSSTTTTSSSSSSSSQPSRLWSAPVGRSPTIDRLLIPAGGLLPPPPPPPTSPSHHASVRGQRRTQPPRRRPFPGSLCWLCARLFPRLSLAPLGGGGGAKGPLWFFTNSSWSTENFALKLVISLWATIPHLVSKN